MNRENNPNYTFRKKNETIIHKKTAAQLQRLELRLIESILQPGHAI